jgi:predicted nuclease of predicted toxin-antitoxin system
MKIKLLLDEDVQLAVAHALRQRGYDVYHAQELNQKGNSDDEQLQFAANNGRCLVSYNVKDFVLLHNEYLQKGKEHFGIIVSRHHPIGETLRRLLNVMQRLSKESIKNQIEFP